MKVYKGKTVSTGIVTGKVFFWEKQNFAVEETKTENPERELVRFRNARERALKELEEIYQKTEKSAGEKEAEIFSVHILLLNDEDYVQMIENSITEQKNTAEYAVALAKEHFMGMFRQMDNDYMKERADDIRDISERVLSNLLNRKPAAELEEPVILVAEELTPGDTVLFDRSKILGFVTKRGSENSHTAILARSMNVPAVIQVQAEKDWDGRWMILDGTESRIILDPVETELKEAKEKIRQEKEREANLISLKDRESITPEGRKIRLYSNAGNVDEIRDALVNGAEGIGLFRSEFIYLNASDYPTEDEQYNIYRTAAEMLNGKLLVIRTLDIGADKKVSYFDLPDEENPALGYRAIRICLTRQELFRTQLRAILRASVYGNIAVMFPMIISVKEVEQAKKILNEVKNELQSQKIPCQDIEIGIMIETPAAAVISDELAELVDFFSLGTNDLTQYTLAIDRQNQHLDTFYDAHHKAVLKLIQMVIENGHKKGCWVGICGELGTDTALTRWFIEQEIDELSVCPASLLKVKDKIIHS